MAITDKISCLDLKQQHEQIRKEVFEAFEKVYEKTAFSGGPFVQEFEKKFSKYVGAKHAVGLCNGTVSLHLAMRVLDIGPGDEVIIPANTFIATAWGVSHAGAKPIFVDCDDTWEIDPSKIGEAITKNTKAVIGVHLYGQPFDIDTVQDICDQNSLFLIEDAAQAHGARYKGKTVGVFGEMACYSFYPGKNLGACGEGGGITTNNDKYAKRLRSLRNHGSIEKYFHDEIGYNYRMGGLEGASLAIKLDYIESWNNKRRAIAQKYREQIINPKVKLQVVPDFADGVHHLFVVVVEDKQAFVDHLAANGIDAAFHYPNPCHLQKAYSYLGHKKGDFPKSEYLSFHCISLPMYAELTEAQVDKVIRTVNLY